MVDLNKKKKVTFHFDKLKPVLVLLAIFFTLFIMYLIVVNIKYIYPYILVLLSLAMIILGFVLVFKDFDNLYSDSFGYLVSGMVLASIGVIVFFIGTANTPVLENMISGIFGTLKLALNILDFIAKPFLDLTSIIVSLLGDQ